MKNIKKVLSFVLAAAMLLGMFGTLGTTASAVNTDDGFLTIFHLDCGRNYFTVAEIEDLIDQLYDAHYDAMELAVGNDALRFIPDDMAITVNGTSYDSNTVKSAIAAGNTAYYNDSKGNYLTESQMDSIIDYAKSKNIDIIPLVNSPGHMDALVSAAKTVTGTTCSYDGSSTTIDVTNSTATAFTKAVLQKYINYFSSKGCTYFNMGCDEYANDVYTSGSMGFGNLISTGKYGSFITYVNELASMVKTAGMTPMAFNDGIYFNNNKSFGTFDTGIVVCYWSGGWGSYLPRSAANLKSDGFKIINTTDSWYYVLGRTGSGTTYSYDNAKPDSVAVTSVSGAIGSMLCVWCDDHASYSGTNKTNVASLISRQSGYSGNSPYFTVSGSGSTDPTEPTDPDETLTEKTIDLTVGETKTDTLTGSCSMTQDPDTSIATASVSASGESWLSTSGATATASCQAYTWGGYNCPTSHAIDGDTTTWYWSSENQAAGMYLRVDLGSAKTISEIKVTPYDSTADSTCTANIQVSSDGTTWTTVGTYDGTKATTVSFDPVSARYIQVVLTAAKSYWWKVAEVAWGSAANTVVSFTGVSEGTTTVTVGNVKYTVNVTKAAEPDITTESGRAVELWITNSPVKPSDWDTYTTFDTNVTSRATGYQVTVNAKEANTDDGIALSSAVPAEGLNGTASVGFWKGELLSASEKQTAADGVDRTGTGTDFYFIRCSYDSSNSLVWYVSADRENWTEVASTDQLVAYYLQENAVTSEIHTFTKDWGYAVSVQDTDSYGLVALSFAVVYPDGTLYPAEEDIYLKSTQTMHYWSGRDIGVIAAQNNSEYEVAKMTVVAGTYQGTSSVGKVAWSTGSSIKWATVEDDSGNTVYDEKVYWDAEENAGTTPMIDGTKENIVYSSADTAYLVLIYLKAVDSESNLNVVWQDDSENAEINRMQIVVGEDKTFLNALQNNGSDTHTGQMVLSDSAYVTNSSGSAQSINKDLTKMTDINAKYRTGRYVYTGAELSVDGMTLTLHYTSFNPCYVVDFALPVSIPVTDLVSSDTISSVKKITVEGAEYQGNTEAVTAADTILWTPKSVMTGIETVEVKVEFTDSVKTYLVGMIPATTVYYEEGFAEASGFTGGSKSSAAQATERIEHTWADDAVSTVSYKQNNYGYDAAAAGNTVAASTGIGDTLTFSFTGTGVTVYAETSENTGRLAMVLRNSEGKIVKFLTIDTHMENGDTEATAAQAGTSNGTPIADITGLVRGSYTLTVSHIVAVNEEVRPVYIDGFRVYGTLADDSSNDAYKADGEAGAQFTEVRDAIIAFSSAETDSIVAYVNGVGYTAAELADLVENGTKNEFYLAAGQSITLGLNSGVTFAQIGLKTLSGTATVTVNGKDYTVSTVDMFYPITGIDSVKITSGNAAISITTIKYFGTVAAVGYTADGEVLSSPLSLAVSPADASGTASAMTGDVNGDGSFNAEDLAVLKAALNGNVTLTAAQIAAADTDGDGAITQADIDSWTSKLN